MVNSSFTFLNQDNLEFITVAAFATAAVILQVTP